MITCSTKVAARASLSLAASLTLAACGPAMAPPPSVEIAAVATGEPPPPPPPPTATAPAHPEAEVLVAPSPSACELAGSRAISPFDKVVSLCLAIEGPCFAEATHSATASRFTATYFDGSARRAGVHLAIDTGPIVVRGIVKTGDVKLYPKALFGAGSASPDRDFIVPVSRVLEIENASSGRALVAIPLGAGISLPGGVVRVERRCDELSIESTRFDAAAVHRFVGGKLTPAKGASNGLPFGKDTPLSAAPGLPPVAVLRPEDDGAAEVDILERRGRDARILWMREGYAVFGWVPAASIRRLNLSNMFGVLGGMAGAAPGQPPSWFTCRAEVPLFVEIASRRVEVGRIRKDGKLMPRDPRSRGFVPVDLSGSPVELQSGARWLVREADFDGNCAR